MYNIFKITVVKVFHFAHLYYHEFLVHNFKMIVEYEEGTILVKMRREIAEVFMLLRGSIHEPHFHPKENSTK